MAPCGRSSSPPARFWSAAGGDTAHRPLSRAPSQGDLDGLVLLGRKLQLRLWALIVILWRAGLRIGEALDLAETDLDESRGAVLVRRAKGGRRREVGMDRWAWSPAGALDGCPPPVAGRCAVVCDPRRNRRATLESSSARKQLARTAAKAGARRRFAPHHLRHAHAVEMAHEGVPLVVIQRHVGHANLGITSIYMQGIDSSGITHAVHSRPAPVIPATAGLESMR